MQGLKDEAEGQEALAMWDTLWKGDGIWERFMDPQAQQEVPAYDSDVEGEGRPADATFTVRSLNE
jgi:hypothetical protein